MIIRLILGAGAAALFAALPVTPARQGLASHTPAGVSARAGLAQMPPAPYGEAGPADSLYRLGREAINRGDFRRAAALFAEISAKYPKSDYAPDAPYWRAFALYRAGRDDELRDALLVLETQQSQFPKATTVADGKELAVRIRGELARRGDVKSAEKVQTEAGRPCTRDDSDNDIRAAALNALLQMDAQNAVPIIKQVLQKRDECSVKLREQAVFLLSQKRTAETEDVLLDVLNNDPSRSVRENAVFWLGQVHTDKAAAALEQIATSSPNMELREKAIFALHEHGSPRAMTVIRGLAENAQVPDHVREQAIFWLGQGKSQENAEFLRSLFTKLDKSERNDELGKKILFSLSQMRGVGNDRWLLSIALDTSNSEELRGHALWTAGQAGVPGGELAAVYDRISDSEVKEKLIWVLSESNDRVATDKLVEIAQKDRDIEMRKKALFWLGQKNDPRIRQIIVDILNKP